MKKTFLFATALAALSMFCSCKDEIEMRYPPKYELPELPVVEGIHENQKAPLYWSVYENCYLQERQGHTGEDLDISEAEWDNIIDWVATNLKPYGYDMICTDGFIPMLDKEHRGYMTHYGKMALKDLVAKCKAKGLKLGIYDNPLWIHSDDDCVVEGTTYKYAGLKWNHKSTVMNPNAKEVFTWAVAENPGCEEFIDGFFKYYKELGVDFIRMDFLSWYEDGKDRYAGIQGRGYGRESYARAMAYIAASAKKYGVFTSLVMPHMYDDAVVEAKYGNMVRIVADTGTGTWWHCSAQDKGKSYTTWPNCMNQFDGFKYWSHIAGRDKIILDGDFLRLNTFDNDNERQTVVSLQLLAGGPVAVADQPSSIGDNLKFYTNSELLALNADGFVGKPLSDKLGENSEVWYGQMKNGDWVVGLFNRDENAATMTVDFSTLGISGEMNVRDLWKHVDEGKASSLTANVPAHGCKIVKLTK